MLNPKNIGDRLNALASIYGAREIGGIALITWIDSLHGEREEDVLSVLEAWPKFHDRMPLPSQVIAECQRRRDESYRQAKAEEMAEKGETFAQFVRRSEPENDVRRAAILSVLDDIRDHKIDEDPYTFWQAELLWKFAHNQLIANAQYAMLYELFGNPIPIAKIEEGCRRYERVYNVPRLDFTEALRREREKRGMA